MIITFQQFWKQNNPAKSLNSDYKEEYKEMLIHLILLAAVCYAIL